MRSSYKRPFVSAPRASIPAIILFYLFWGSTLPVAAMALGPIFVGYDLLDAHFLLILILTSVPALVVIFGLRNGQPWSLKIMRVLSVLGVIAIILDAGVGLMLTLGFAGRTRSDVLGGEFLLVVCMLLAAMAFFLFRTLRRVRWLDPYSTPDEWEPPMRRARRFG